jgi:excinuclease ABC subunit C
MLDAEGTVIYVGKARDLQKRVSSYFQCSSTDPKLRALVAQIATIEVTITNTESEALLLEDRLIKTLRPRYNVLLRDDKSYPYIYLSSHDEYPRLAFYRGARQGKGRFFGPYPSAGAVRETLNLLQKLFPVRQCEDSFFRNRSRPCLQYQIRRCTAPCVGLVEHATYTHDVDNAVLFLEGKSTAVIENLVARMERASAELDFEQAATYRDQIASLRRVHERQYVSGEHGDVDIVAGVVREGLGCVQVFYVRRGHNLGNRTFFPRVPRDTDVVTMLEAFLPQYYLHREIPAEILVNQELNDTAALEEVLTQRYGQRVSITARLRGSRARWVRMAETNANHSVTATLASRAGMSRRVEDLRDALQLEAAPERIECFDISHTAGESTVASCVVFDGSGPVKADYRRFNIRDVEAGDDYGAIEQALLRRYTRLKRGEGRLPDLLLIDGGKGQLSVAERVLEELQVEGVMSAGVAKGSDRKPGLETLFITGRQTPLVLPDHSPGLHLIQQIRDEAHRFAITGHRQRRDRRRRTSVLEDIPGLGPKRRQTLLKQFGGLREVARAGIDDLVCVKGISRQLAEQIYATFHGDG